MIAPQHIIKPWKGYVNGPPIYALDDGYVTHVRGFLFSNGVLELAPFFTAYRGFPPIDKRFDSKFGTGTVKNPRKMFVTNTRQGDHVMIFMTPTGVYIGGLNRVYKILDTANGWEVVNELSPTFVQYVSDSADWFIMHDGKSDGIYKFWYGVDETAVQVNNRYDPILLQLMHAKYITVFNERLVFGNLYMPEGPMGHAIAWFGITGPFDNEFPSAGYRPLTDEPGDITGLTHCRNFLVIFKEGATYVGAKNTDPNDPIRTVRADPNVGCLYVKTVQQIPRSKIITFVDQNQNVRVFDAESSEIISTPVANELIGVDLSSSFSGIDKTRNLYMLALPDRLLCWNYLENWWTILERPEHLTDFLPYVVDDDVLLINEVQGIIDDTPGLIDLGGHSVVNMNMAGVHPSGFTILSSDIERAGIFRTKEWTFPKPITISRFRLDVKNLTGGTILCRHSTDGGTSWSPWDGMTSINIDRMQHVFYNFVVTQPRIMFEVFVKAKSCVIADMHLEIAPDKQQAPRQPRYADYVGTA